MRRIVFLSFWSLFVCFYQLLHNNFFFFFETSTRIHKSNTVKKEIETHNMNTTWNKWYRHTRVELSTHHTVTTTITTKTQARTKKNGETKLKQIYCFFAISYALNSLCLSFLSFFRFLFRCTQIRLYYKRTKIFLLSLSVFFLWFVISVTSSLVQFRLLLFIWFNKISIYITEYWEREKKPRNDPNKDDFKRHTIHTISLLTTQNRDENDVKREQEKKKLKISMIMMMTMMMG